MRRKELKKCFAAICAIALSFQCIACAPSMKQSETSDNVSENQQINSFMDYTWGTTIDKIKKNEITSDMEENIDYMEDTTDDSVMLTITGKEVAGYKTDIGFLFSNNGLEMGCYDLDIEDDDYTDLIEKYTAKYGAPTVEKESTGWGPCTIWIDDNQNFICITDVYGIIYSTKSNSFVTNTFNDFLKEYHEIDLYEELNKIGNSDGI